jgi:hypothetical protein
MHLPSDRREVYVNCWTWNLVTRKNKHNVDKKHRDEELLGTLESPKYRLNKHRPRISIFFTIYNSLWCFPSTMKNSKPYPSITIVTAMSNATTISNTAAMDTKRGYGMDEFIRKRGDKEAASATTILNSVPSDAPRSKRGCDMDEFRSKPGDRVPASATTILNSVPSDAPRSKRGYDMDEFRRKPGDQVTASATTILNSVPSNTPRRKRGFGMDEFRHTRGDLEPASGTAPSSSVPSDAPRRKWARHKRGDQESASATAPSSSVPSDAPRRKRGKRGYQEPASATTSLSSAQLRPMPEGDCNMSCVADLTSLFYFPSDAPRRKRGKRGDQEPTSATTPSSSAQYSTVKIEVCKITFTNVYTRPYF